MFLFAPNPCNSLIFNALLLPKWLKSTKSNKVGKNRTKLAKIEQSWQKSNKDEQNRKAGLQFKNMQFNL